MHLCSRLFSSNQNQHYTVDQFPTNSRNVDTIKNTARYIRIRFESDFQYGATLTILSGRNQS